MATIACERFISGSRVSAEATRIVARAIHRGSLGACAALARSIADRRSARADRASQQIERAPAREIRCGWMERSAPIAVEPVARALIHEDFGVLAVRERGPDLVDCGHRNSLVGAAEVKLNRTFHRARLAEKAVYSAAVIA